MADVKRYDFETDDETGAASIIERQNGDYVSFEDYDEAATEVQRLKNLIRDATETLRDA